MRSIKDEKTTTITEMKSRLKDSEQCWDQQMKSLIVDFNMDSNTHIKELLRLRVRMSFPTTVAEPM